MAGFYAVQCLESATVALCGINGYVSRTLNVIICSLSLSSADKSKEIVFIYSRNNVWSFLILLLLILIILVLCVPLVGMCVFVMSIYMQGHNEQ